MQGRLLGFLDRHPAVKEKVKKVAFRTRLTLSPSPTVKARYLAYDHGLFFSALRDNANKNGRELHSLMHLQHVVSAMQAVGAEPQGEILEIGAGRAGLPILLLLLGFDKVHVNELTNVVNRFDRHFVRSIQVLASLAGYCRRPLEEVVVAIDDDHVAIRPELVSTHAFTDAAELDLETSHLAAAVSFTVFEHLTDPKSVLNKLHQCLDVGGWMCHVADMRDHDDFRDPLKFLTVPPSEYRPVRGDWCNRFRHSDFVRVFEETGFSPVATKVTAFNELDKYESTDFWSMIEQGLDHVYKPALEAEEIWVTDEILSTLAAENRHYDRADLSVLQAAYVVRRNDGS